MTSVAVSILNFNSAALTVRCVESLLVAARRLGAGNEVRVFVADNGSDPEDVAALEKALAGNRSVEMSLHGANLGFSAGHNRNLVRIFDAGNPDFTWVLNNDCVVAEGAIEALIACAAARQDVGIWGATLLEEDGRTMQCAGGCRYNSWLTTFRAYGRGRLVDDRHQMQEPDYDYIAGASLFFPASTLRSGLSSGDSLFGNKPGGYRYFNESFFLYFEELDLAKRLRRGLRLGWCRDALITHAGGASTGTKNARQAQSEYHSTLSALVFTGLHYQRRLWIAAPMRLLLKSLQLLVTGRFRLLANVLEAERTFFRKLRERD